MSGVHVFFKHLSIYLGTFINASTNGIVMISPRTSFKYMHLKAPIIIDVDQQCFVKHLHIHI